MSKRKNRGQIICKGPDSWLIRIYLGRDEHGKKKYYSKSVRGNKTTAGKFLTAKLSELDSGETIAEPRLTLSDFLREWLIAMKSRVSPQTFQSYESLLRVHVAPRIGMLKVAEVKLTHVQKVYASMEHSGLAPRTIKYVHSVLSMAMKKAVQLGTVRSNPCDFADLPKQTRSETKAMSAEQTARFLSAANDHSHGLIYEFAMITGMRPEEYLSLRWADVDLVNGIAKVRRALIRVKGGFEFGETKTKSSRRSIPLPTALVKKLDRHRRLQLAQRLKLGPAYQNFDLVFATEIGTPHHIRNLATRSYRQILKVAGLDEMGFVLYSLRHTCATLLLEVGENPKVVAERLGHSSVKMTLDTYTHVLPDMQKSASDRLSHLIYGEKTGT